MFKFFEFKEGKLKILPTLSPKHIKGVVIISIIAIIISALSSQFKIDERQLWKIYTALIERLGLQPQLPDIKDNEKKLDAEIELEVDRAIREYERLTGDDGRVRIPSPRYSEKPVDTSVCYTDECKSLGGEMRICAPWVDSCPKQ
jgi:hypothetical protein